MKKKIAKPEFDSQGYQANINSINDEPLPKKLHRLSDEEFATIGMPPLAALAGEVESATKITLAVDDDALEFFKREAKKRKTSYQRMLRNLIRAYARQHANPQNKRLKPLA